MWLLTKQQPYTGYDWVVFIDSDAYFTRVNVTIPAILHEYMPAHVLNSTVDVFFGGNLPYGESEPCSGIFFVRNSPEARSFLLGWWNVHIPKNNMGHPYEQAALQNVLLNISSHIMYTSGELQPFSKGHRGQYTPIKHIWTGGSGEVNFFSFCVLKKTF